MNDQEVTILDNLLNELQPRTCLEWGSGGSTLYFPVTHKESIMSWTSLEHDKNWYELVKAERPSPNVTLIYQDFPEYLTLPNGKFDFILVDGRQRLACLQAIKDRELLAKGGIVVLHDSGRLRYRPGFDLFDHWEEISPSSSPTPDGGLEDQGLVKFWND
jgi:predicted O-methyltransferase YrrM